MKLLTALPLLLACASSLPAQGVYPNARSGGNYMHNYYFPPAGSSTPWWPSWSPDGRRLAYVSTEPNGYFNIHVMEINNGQKGAVTAVTTDNRFGRDRLYFGDVDVHISPTWSPDGGELLFVSNRGIPLGSGGIWRAPVEPNVMGTGRARLIHKEETLFRTRPHWSADGKRIVYSSHLGGQYVNLFVLPATGGEPYKMTFGEYDNFHPRWSPDGEWIAYISNEDGLPQLKLLKSWGGEQRLVKFSSRRWSRPMGVVTVRVLDGETGRETPARIYQKASDGKVYTPGDSYERLSTLDEHLFHTPGRFTVEAPPGTFSVEAVKGFEYLPVKETIDVKAGQVHSITLTLKRLTNLKARGWFSGSNHVHMNYAGNLHNTPENLFLMNAAEDADMIGHQIANKDNRILDYQYWVKGRDQQAIGAYVHPFGGNRDPLETSLGAAKGFPVDVALGTVDYHEMWSQAGDAGLLVWHHILNNGFRIPATGGEDSISSLHRTNLVGAMRGYFHLGPGNLSWANYMKALLAGRGFVTNAPLLEFAANTAMPGEEIRLPAGGGAIRFRAVLNSIAPIDRFELVSNGNVIEKIPLTGDRRHAEFDKEIRVTSSGWYTLQAISNQRAYPIEDNRPMATTNPIYVVVDNQPIRSRSSADYFVRWIDKLTGLASAHPGWRSEKEKQHVLSQFREARAVYVKRGGEAK